MTAMKEQPSARQIYGTIGPACADVKTLEAMFRAGMTGIRLNLSHVTLAQAADQVDALHKAAQRCGKQAELLIDMQGPELRVGVLAEPMTLNEGEVLELGGKGIPLPDIAIPALLPGQEVLLDDGKLLLRGGRGPSRRRSAGTKESGSAGSGSGPADDDGIRCGEYPRCGVLRCHRRYAALCAQPTGSGNRPAGTGRKRRSEYPAVRQDRKPDGAGTAPGISGNGG